MEIKSINPASVPQRTLSNGAMIPAVGIGTFGSDNYDNETIANALKVAVRHGYRHIDCAAVYGNEAEIGVAIKELIAEGTVTREELWITSKLWNDQHDNVIEACKKSMADLQLDYLDLYLVHWPFPNFHAKGVSVESRDPNAKPYIHADFMATWSKMEELVEMGLVKNIGTSNVTKAKMELILKDCKIKPVINEMEIHPHFQQPELFDYMMANGIQPIGFCPIGSPNRPERDKTAEDTVPIEDPTIVAIAKAHGVHPAVICLKWAVQRGEIVIPFSVKPEKFMSNLECAVVDPLTEEEMAQMKAIDKGNRFIKGQVFCWVGADWQDLWDEDGVIKGC
ncbi:MAG: aldo/keto reductase [Rikenellaceae bacterium]